MDTARSSTLSMPVSRPPMPCMVPCTGTIYSIIAGVETVVARVAYKGNKNRAGFDTN